MNSNETAFPKPANFVMSQSWQNGELPASLLVFGGSADQVATVLAQECAARGSKSVRPPGSRLCGSAGFFITPKNGWVLHAPPDGKVWGLPTNGWQVASVARMYGDNRAVSLIEPERQLKSVPFLRGFAADAGSVGAILTEGVRANADDARHHF